MSASSSFLDKSLWGWGGAGLGGQYNFEVAIMCLPNSILLSPQLDQTKLQRLSSLTTDGPENGLMQLPSQ